MATIIYPLGLQWLFDWWKNQKEEENIPPPTGDQTEQDQFFVFSPFAHAEGIELELLVVALAAVKLSKTPEGLKVIKELGVEYLKTLGKVLEALETSSSSHWLVAMINQKLSARVMKRLGLLSAGEAASLESSYNWMFTITMAKEGIVETLNGLGSMFKGAAPLVSAAAGA